jgi:hypothetical protein
MLIFGTIDPFEQNGTLLARRQKLVAGEREALRRKISFADRKMGKR